MRKYLAIFTIGIKNALTYRVELLLWSVIDAIPLVSVLVIWLSAYGERDEIAGYTRTALIGYYILGYIFQDMTGAHFEEDTIDDIQRGTISGKLIKPFSLKIGLLVSEVSWRVMAFFSNVGPVVLFVALVGRNIFTSLTLTKETILFLLLFLALAYLLETIYSLMIVAMGFIFEEAYSLSHLRWMLGWLLSGSMMPFEFMPTWLSQIASWLPFKFRYYIPVQIAQGRIASGSVGRELVLEVIWLVVLVVLMRALWKRNLKHYTAVGG